MGETMSVQVRDVQFYVHNMRTRMPFRYGIASMTAVPYLFTTCDLAVDGRSCRGIAADLLPPKWFTKDPKTTFRDDLPAMLRVITSAGVTAMRLDGAATVFDLWQQLYEAQRQWAEPEGYPPLLWNFGVSLVERATISAFCRATGVSFSDAVRNHTLGIRLDAVTPELRSHT